MDYTKIIEKIGEAIPDTIKRIFDIIDKLVPDRDAANELKVSMAMLVQGKDAKYWLPANAFTIAMLTNCGLLTYFMLMDKTIPEWSLWIAGTWLLGPLLNTLDKSTISKLGDIVKGVGNWQQKRREERIAQVAELDRLDGLGK